MSDLCFVEHDDWTGPHQRLDSCPDEIPSWVKWFINEDGEVYDYDARTQKDDFPNDFHIVYDTEAEAVKAAEALKTIDTFDFDHGTDPDPTGGAPVEQMAYDQALSYAIFAINTYLYPDASRTEDMERLEANADNIIASLVDIRETVRGMGPIEAEIRRRLAAGE